MTRRHLCRDCGHFRPGATGYMKRAAPIDSDDELGVCEASPPIPMKDESGYIIGHQPIVHETRSCVDFVHRSNWEEGDDPPPAATVRHLHPVKPAA